MIEILQRAQEARVAPPRVLRRHPHHEPADLREYARPSGPPSRVRPFSGDELPMPPQNRVGCDERRDLRQHPTAEPLAEDGQPSPVVLRQPQTPMAQLRLQDSVFLAQVEDDLVLFTLEPAEEGRDETAAPESRCGVYADCWAWFSDTRRFGTRRAPDTAH